MNADLKKSRVKNGVGKRTGHVYVLTSRNCKYIKIGGTDFPPMKRVNEINSVEPYQSLGPWELNDFRQVTDWRAVERHLHYVFRSKCVKSVKKQKELFLLPALSATTELEKIDVDSLIGKPKIDRMFQDEVFASYLMKLFSFTGVLNWLSLQGAWTFCLFPSTGGGRYFTLNIGPHEVAFTTNNVHGQLSTHMIYMDSLIHDFPETVEWIRNHSGELHDDLYITSLDRSTSVSFQGDFSTALEFFTLPGVRRATIAYWTEALILLQERKAKSVFERFHNYNAVAELKRRMARAAPISMSAVTY